MHQPRRWWLGFPVLLILWIIATATNMATVEADLSARARTAAANAIDEARAVASGRDIALSGSARAPDAIARAIAAVDATFGVRKVIAGITAARPAADANAAQPLTSAASCEAELAAVVSRERIRFKTGSADLDESSAPVLVSVLSIAKRCQTGAIEVAGHTDNQGNEQSNMTLSTARAQAVTRHLAANGIDAARLSAVGFGDTRPVASNDTDAGRAQNRRIEFRVR